MLNSLLLTSHKNNLIRNFTYLLFILSVFFSCQSGEIKSDAKVHLLKGADKYTLIQDGKPFTMKGASGTSHFSKLSMLGGNTLRVWDTTHLAVVLDSAKLNGLSVIVGLPFINNDDLAFYKNPQKVKHQHDAFQSIVKRYKDHPALLMWCIGNELDFPFRLKYNSFYNAFNDLTDMIHQVDPDHPVTTTVLNFNKKYIANIQLRCNIDVISFNIFGKLYALQEDLASFSWFWDGPYMLLEWGFNGPWEGTAQTAWSAYIEDSSPKKAEILKQRYQHYMPKNDARFLGACVFFWGNKQETTHTWFSLFDEQGNESEAVGMMQSIWTGIASSTQYPSLNYMLVNGKGAGDNILMGPGDANIAELHLRSQDTDIQKVRWEIYKEDWYKENGQNNTRKQIPITTLKTSGNDLKATFQAPTEEGPYRLFATLYDNKGHFATCNTPFYVVDNP
jgi:hypothetical protein